MLSHLGEISVEDFLRDYWQKKPLLIRQGITDLTIIDANELAGFALETDVESRLIIETPQDTSPLDSQWQLIHGPLDDDAFTRLPPSHWTLLVQAVDQLSPELHQLRKKFAFIPNWRIDDIMVSYASDGGNVGPHFDYYDVFLVQASGTREWRLGQVCDGNSPLRQDTDCKLLTQFTPSDSWVLEPGDILYIPPCIAHWGIARGECMTYSVGFRAPSDADLVLDLAQELASHWPAHRRFSDPDLRRRDNPGELRPEDVEKVRALLIGIAEDRTLLTQWLGCYMTQPKRDQLVYQPQNQGLSLSPAARLAYAIDRIQPDQAQLYANGQVFPCNLALAKVLCGHPTDDNLTKTLENLSGEQDSNLIRELQAHDILI